jgi:hypothetical protein
MRLPFSVWAFATLAACAPNPTPVDSPSSAAAASSTLTPFGSEEAFMRYQQQMERDWQARIRKRPPYGSYRAAGTAADGPSAATRVGA